MIVYFQEDLSKPLIRNKTFYRTMVCDGNQELKEFSFQAIFRKIKWKYLKYTKYHILGGTFCPNMDKMIVFCKILDIKIIELHVRAENHKKLMNHSWEKCGPITRFLPRQRLLVQSQLWKHLKMPEILLKLTIETPQRRQWQIKQISHIVLVFPLTSNR